MLTTYEVKKWCCPLRNKMKTGGRFGGRKSVLLLWGILIHFCYAEIPLNYELKRSHQNVKSRLKATEHFSSSNNAEHLLMGRRKNELENSYIRQKEILLNPGNNADHRILSDSSYLDPIIPHSNDESLSAFEHRSNVLKKLEDVKEDKTNEYVKNSEKTRTTPKNSKKSNYQQEKLLLQYLMEGYERDVRPVENASDTVVVEVGITLTQILNMDEKNQVLTAIVWLDQEWQDEFLQWDPKDFGGIEQIRLPCERIWVPDIVLYNNADDYGKTYMASRAMVNHKGKVFWPPPTRSRSSCQLDVTYFPFDDQNCLLKLGSWIYDGFQVDVTNRTTEVDLTNYVPNGEWDLIQTSLRRNVVHYSCCPEFFPDVTIYLTIRRKTLYYIFNIVLPCIMLSILTLLVFCLPPDSGEKVALGITVLLAFSVFMLAIAEKMPETSESVPLIGVYLTVVMAITSVSVVVTVIVLNLHYLGPRVKPVPLWLRRSLPADDRKYIRQQSLLIPAHHKDTRSGSMRKRHILLRQAGERITTIVPDSINNGKAEDLGSESSFDEMNCESSKNILPRSSTSDKMSDKPLEKDLVLLELLKSIRHLTNKQEEIENQNILIAEWRLAAQAVDRVLFWIFTIITAITSAIFLLFLPIYKRTWFGP